MADLPAIRSAPGSVSGLATELHIRHIALDLVLSILTCALWNLYVQYRQMLAVNDMLGQRKYTWLSWFLLTMVTCGIYHIYHEYRFSADIAAVMQTRDANEPIISLLLTIFGLAFVADAIQQAAINQHYGDSSL